LARTDAVARRGRGRRTKEMVQVARERIDLLMAEADRAALSGRIELADRYVELARRVGMRYNVRVPTAHKRKYCRGCYGYLLPSVTSRTRFQRGKVVTTCLRCGHVVRVPLEEREDGSGRLTAPVPDTLEADGDGQGA
jgi:ribonuclease P protein subunit RPR2